MHHGRGLLSACAARGSAIHHSPARNASCKTRSDPGALLPTPVGLSIDLPASLRWRRDILHTSGRWLSAIVADVHFHFERALEAIEAGVHKIRLNPGNISDKVQVAKVIDYETALHNFARANHGDLLDAINKTGDYDENIAGRLMGVCADFAEKGAY